MFQQLTSRKNQEQNDAPQENGPQEDQQSDKGAAPPAPKNDRFYLAYDRFSKKPPPPLRSILPSLDLDIEDGPGHHPQRNKEGVTSSEKSGVSYEEACATCKSKVQAIVDECRRINIKYFDRTFDLPTYDTLASLAPGENPYSVDDAIGVGMVRRVEDIFDNPRFIKDGATANDIRQGRAGDCWFLAAVTALSGTEEPNQQQRLLTKLCVARDEQVGVYGFVFYRDGEWVSEVVDDRLCQRHAAENQKQYICRISADETLEKVELKPSNFEPLQQYLRDSLSKGSDTLYFSSCRDSDETWLPLLEKAYAKAHGDYQSIEYGLSGEGIEDLTGGVNNAMDSEDILDKDKLWDELLRVNEDFLFGCSSRRGNDHHSPDSDGFIRGHAYTVLQAKELDKVRLLKIRNPWGRQEWNGAWSDGSKEWTPRALQELEHIFGDDGIFWISYKDFLKYYSRIDRTRLFGPEWTVTQQWTSVNVPNRPTYLDTRFRVHIHKTGPVVIVLSQPDSRYFQGYEGRYRFSLHFRLYQDGQPTYLLRSMSRSGLGRSCSAELELNPGSYTVIVKITATQLENYPTAEELIRKYQRAREDKLLTVGKSYDLTHSKGLLREKERENANTRKQEAKSRAVKNEARLLRAQRAWKQEVKRKIASKKKRIEEAMKVKYQAKVAMRKFSDNERSGTNRPPLDSNEEDDEDDDDKAEEEDEEEDEDEQDERAQDESEDQESESEMHKIKAEPPQIQQNGLRSRNNTQNGDTAQAEELDDDAVSQVTEMSDGDFEWNSEIDDPPGPIEASDDEERLESSFNDDRWNAICVVGLRVHSLATDTKVEVVESSQNSPGEVA